MMHAFQRRDEDLQSATQPGIPLSSASDGFDMNIFPAFIRNFAPTPPWPPCP
jgi:hypothetical protein